MTTRGAPDPPQTPGFREECAMLASLESFDPEAFRGNAEVPQALCNFVLSIALIYNDCKDAVYAHVALTALKPDGPPLKTRAWGALSGVQLHVFRAVAALLHELFELIRSNQDLLGHDFFLSVLKQVSSRDRRAWVALVSAARDAVPTDELGRRLLLFRNKVSFHYDLKAIFRGYSQHFLDTTKRDDRAYLSRGNSMRETRFYFADAAALGYLRSVVGPEQMDELMWNIGEIVDQVNHGLRSLVGTFVQRRGFSYRAEAEP